MIGWATALSLLCAYASALPHGTSKTETFQPPITVGDQSTPTNGGYVYITVTCPNTTTYTSTIFSTITSHPAGNNSVFTLTKTAIASPAALPATPVAPGVTNGINQQNAQQTPKQNSSLQALTTLYVTKTTPIKQHSTLTLAGDYQNANAAASDIVETVTHTIFNTVSAKKRPPPVTHFVTVTHSTVVTGKPATILTSTETITTTLTTLTATKTVTSNMKLSTQSDGKRDIILWKRNHPGIEFFEDGSTATSALSAEKTIEARAVPTAPQQTSITVTKTYTPSTAVYTTKTITVSGTWVPRANSTTTMTIPSTVGAGSQAVEQQINAISVATMITVEPIVSTIAPPPPPPTTTEPLPTTSIKTVDVTNVVTVSNYHTSTITKTITHVITSTMIPPSSVLTKTTTITDTATISGIYTMFVVSY